MCFAWEIAGHCLEPALIIYRSAYFCWGPALGNSGFVVGSLRAALHAGSPHGVQEKL